MQKLPTFFFSKNISVHTIFNDQSFNDTLTNDIIRFEQLGPELYWMRNKSTVSTMLKITLQLDLSFACVSVLLIKNKSVLTLKYWRKLFVLIIEVKEVLF